MNPGSHAFATAIDDTPASRSSLTMRSCNVPNALLSLSKGDASLRLRAVGTDDVNVQRQQRATELGHSVAAGSLLAVHPEDAMLVTVQRHRLAVLLQIGAGRPEVVKRRFRGDEPQLHQPARRVIHKSQQRAWGGAILEPGVLRAGDLHKFARTLAPPTRLRRRGQKMPTVLPQPIADHPTAQGLARDQTAVMLRQFLRRHGLGRSRHTAPARSTAPERKPQRGADDCWVCLDAWK